MTASPTRPRVAVVVSCEHGGNRVPSEYRSLFRGWEDVLESHRGWDPGTGRLARSLAGELDAPLHLSTTTRLLVDLNRSPGHPRVFSSRTRALPPGEREEILRRWHAPYRRAVRTSVEERLEAGGVVLHLSVHSFTPVLDGRERRTDLALLYDPAREREAELAARWAAALRERLPGRRVRRNHPYRGASDGLTTWLRGSLETDRYLGVEVEVSQGCLEGGRFPRWVETSLTATLREALGEDSLAGSPG